ncbi:organic cation/carnitine transporter 3 [Beta vulgaris subsp. vulgaris]|uniref:organic cation/carnitine transporter 3 n=1 Tax=Beta vulgaris subsp. vulgaris TaxID=3555 RepID=UPI002036861A|nr:organic cation/carnitine transporter 3 [Beta vulgaris subsp. vulgaris]
MEQNVAKFVEEAAGQNPVPASMSIEDIIEQSIGRINSTQILQAILTALAALFDSQQTYISIFAHAQPTWHCTSSNANSKISCSSNNNSNICRLSKSDWAWDSPNVHTSIISEWDLECASSFITGFPTTCYFVGCLLGGLVLATLGDSSIGRKKLLCISFLFMSLAALASSFSPNLWVYSLLRFLCGIGRAPLTITSIVLQTEKTCKRWRSQLIMIGFINISLGILTLTGIAYLTKASSWRNLYL